MKIIIIEGLKGTGKSLVCNRIKERYNIEIMEKFTKGEPFINGFLIPFKEKYGQKFKNIESSLGMDYYSHFFHSLEKCGGNNIYLFNRGLLSLRYYGFYGYRQAREILSYSEYLIITEEVYRSALEKYKQIEKDTVFCILETGEKEIRKRLKGRKMKIPSDEFFLDNFETYKELKESGESVAKDKLLKSSFLTFENNHPRDLENIIETLGHIIE